jgi:hypothetical protein
MGFFSGLLWWGGTLFLAGLLWRMSRLTLWKRFPYFSVYAAGVLCSTFVRLYLQPVTSRAYALGYWISEFACTLLAYGVILEIYRYTLAPYRGLRKVARLVLSVLFVLIAAKAGAELWANPLGLRSTTIDLERNLRVVETLLLVAIVGLVVHYAVPLGRNIRCMLVGYGLYLGVRITLLSILSTWELVFHPWVNVLMQSGWVLALTIWCVGMWSDAPNPVPDPLLECTYENVSLQTVRAMDQLRDHVIHSWRS